MASRLLGYVVTDDQGIFSEVTVTHNDESDYDGEDTYYLRQDQDSIGLSPTSLTDLRDALTQLLDARG
jgi:hypothetical protein